MYKRTDLSKIRDSIKINKHREIGRTPYTILVCKCGCGKEFKVTELKAREGRKYYNMDCYLKKLKG